MSAIPPYLPSLPAAARTVAGMLHNRALVAPERPVLRIDDQDRTVAQLQAAAAARAGGLQAAGVRRGDRVALLLGNRWEFVEMTLACAWLGAVAVPINTASRGEQLQHILRNCGAQLLVIEQAIWPALPFLRLGELALRQIWVLDGAGEALAAEVAVQPWPAPGAPVPAADMQPGDPFAILYTSGTSGPSKGVVCPHAQFYWWAVYTGSKLGLRPADVQHTTLPLFHTNALNAMFQALLFESTLVVEARFSVSQFFERLVHHKATVTYLLGAMVPMLLTQAAKAAEKAHTVRIALAPGVPGDVYRQFHERCGIGLLDGYGSTETNHIMGNGLHEQRPGWMGKVAEGFEALVVDDQDNPVSDGTPGELLVRAREPFAFALGYFAMPEKTVEAWRNLWFHTGDRVVRDGEGFYRFLDRIKDSIRRRGENISSYEVEQAILTHPAVANVAVYAVKSELAEDDVMAAIVLREGHTLTPEDVMRHCENRVSYFAVPRYVEFLAELPATENGKIQKYKLRERGVVASTWDREAVGYQVKR